MPARSKDEAADVGFQDGKYTSIQVDDKGLSEGKEAVVVGHNIT